MFSDGVERLLDVPAKAESTQFGLQHWQERVHWE